MKLKLQRQLRPFDATRDLERQDGTEVSGNYNQRDLRAEAVQQKSMRRGGGCECGGYFWLKTTEKMKPASWMREGQRESLSLSLSTTSDVDSNEEGRSALPGHASAFRREGNRQTGRQRWRRQAEAVRHS